MALDRIDAPAAAEIGAHAASASTRAPWTAIAAGIAVFVCVAPTAAVLLQALSAPGGGQTDGLWWDSVLGAATLMALGGGGAVALGVAAAWLAAMCAFPGRGAFEWLLILPLALPAYVLAYAYGGMAGPGGPSPVRLSGTGAAAFVYAVGFYPYVYLAARAAFVSQSACALEAARSLGASPLRAFWRIGLPLARPAIAAGAALALMEIAADYGAAAYFGVPTITTGVFRAWFARGEPGLAMQLASVLLLAAAAALIVERGARGDQGFAGGSARWRVLPRYGLGAWGWAAAAFCAALVTLGALAPFAWLARSASMLPADALVSLAEPLRNTLLLALGGGCAALVISAIVAALSRRSGRAGQAALFAAAIGYAAPGAVIALGVLALVSALRGAGLMGGLTGAAALGVLIWAYAARFAAAGAQPIEAGLARVTKSVSGAARTLGASPLRRTLEVEAPIAAPSVVAAALIVFVEILKELPATLILRPFDFDTLAVKAHAYAADDRLIQAAAPSLLIALAGLAPIILLSRKLSQSRAGHS